MILPANEHDFEVLAQEAATGFLTNGDLLNDGVVKIASRENLNPEEIRRLIEKTNLVTTLQMLKVSTDKQVEFALADYDQVIAKTHPANQGLTVEQMDKAAADISDHFPDMYVDESDRVSFTKAEKKANTEQNLSREIFRARQKLDYLKQQKVAAELKVVSGMESLLSVFERYHGPDFTKFANTLYTLEGESARPVIETLSIMLRIPVQLEKVAEIIDDADPLLKKYAQVKHSLVAIIEAQQLITKTAQEHDSLWKASGAESLYAGEKPEAAEVGNHESAGD